MFWTIIFNAFLGIVIGISLSIISTIIVYDFINFTRKFKNDNGTFVTLYMALLSLIKSFKDMVLLKTEGFKISKKVLSIMSEVCLKVFSSYKPIVGFSGITFLIGAFYISCLTKYYGINAFVSISITDYILYFFNLIDSYNNEYIAIPIIYLFTYIAFMTYYFVVIDMANDELKKNVLRKSARANNKSNRSAFMVLSILMIPFATLLISTYIRNQTETMVKDRVVRHIKQDRKTLLILKDNDFMYFLMLNKAKVAILPLNPKNKVENDSDILQQANYIVSISKSLKGDVCKNIKQDLKKSHVTKQTVAYLEFSKGIYC